MSTPSNRDSSPRTLLDALREAGKADELISEIEVRVARRKRARQAVAGWLGAALALCVAALVTVNQVRNTDRIVTAAREFRAVVLPDGSQLEMSALTRVKTDFRFGRRQVRIEEGEAFLDVVKDPDHPFIVRTPVGAVQVTGTRFVVRVPSVEQVEVTLVDGAIAFHPSEGVPVPLSPSQQLNSSVGVTTVRSLGANEVERVMAWRRGQIVLDGMTLAEVARRYSQFHGCTIRVGPGIAEMQLGGTRVLEDLEGFLQSVALVRDVAVVRRADGAVELLPQ